MIAFLSLFLSSCSTSGWRSSMVSSPRWGYDVARTYVYADAFSPSMMLEVVRTFQGVRLYLNLCTFSFPDEKGYSSQIPISVEIGDEECSVLVHRFSGGQRLLFPAPTAQWIVDHLCMDDSVRITVGHIRAVFPSAGFFDALERVMSAPIPSV